MTGQINGHQIGGQINKLEQLRGYSAYEIALLHGYTGTEEEWLASLHGADGQSAYNAAVEGGYTGTESEFMTLLANLPKEWSDLGEDTVETVYLGETTGTDIATASIELGWDTGKPYIVKFDGVEYECSVYLNNEDFYIGNGHLIPNLIEDFGIFGEGPFGIKWWVGTTNELTFYTEDGNPSAHSFEILTRETVINPIPEAYLPKQEITWQDLGEDREETLLLPEIAGTQSATVIAALPNQAGAEIAVRYDGTEYLCTVQQYEANLWVGNGAFIAANASSEPFCVHWYTWDSTVSFYTEDGSPENHSFAITKVDRTIHPVPGEYLPVKMMAVTFTGIPIPADDTYSLSFVCDTPAAEIIAAIKAGAMICSKVVYDYDFGEYPTIEVSTEAKLREHVSQTAGTLQLGKMTTGEWSYSTEITWTHEK